MGSDEHDGDGYPCRNQRHRDGVQKCSRKENLIGYFHAMEELREWLNAHDRQILRLPSKRPGYQGRLKRYEEIEQRSCSNR
jgi:hypothetical protein